MLKTKIIAIVLVTGIMLSGKQVLGQATAGKGYDLPFASKIHIGGMLGISRYSGDFNSPQSKFAAAGNVTWDITNHISLRGQLTYGGLGGSDTYLGSFSSNFLDAALLGEYNFIDIYHSHDFTPYVTAGIADARFFHREAPASTGITPNKYAFNVPVGAGVKYIISDNITVRLEGLLRFPFTDNLDGVRAGSHNDVFGQVMIGASFRLASLIHSQRYE